MRELHVEVARFKWWAPPKERRHGEWECDYEHWQELYEAAESAIDQFKDGNISDELTGALIYSIGRDNEVERLRQRLLGAPSLLSKLAQAVITSDESDAKWQIAVSVAEAGFENAIDLIRPFLHDSNEYVRRRSLMVLVSFSPLEAENIAVSNMNDAFEYTRIAALHVLYSAGSTQLGIWLARLADDPNEYVRFNVQCISLISGMA